MTRTLSIAIIAISLFGHGLSDSLWQRATHLPLFDIPDGGPLSFPDFLYDNGLYADAITEYERYLFHNPQGKSTDYALFKKAMAEIEANDLRSAENSLDALSELSPDHRTKVRARIIAALLDLRDKNPTSARTELDYLEGEIPRDFRGELTYFRGWALLLEGRDQDAATAFNDVIRDEGADDIYRKSAYEIHRYITHYPPNETEKIEGLAQFLSGIVPGLGQAYAGDPLSGLNSLALNGGIAYLVIRNIDLGKYFQAAYIFYFLWRRYYFGGIELAGDKAREYNATVRDTYLLALMDSFIPAKGGD